MRKRKNSFYQIKKIGKEKNRELLAILKDSPVTTKELTLCFDKEPDVFLSTELKSDRLKCIGFYRKLKLLGFAMMAYQNVYINYKPQTVMYLCNVYLKKEGRYKGFIYRSTKHLLKEMVEDGEIKLGYTIIMKGNKSAESIVGRRHPKFPHMPHSKAVSSIMVKNIILTFKKMISFKYQVRLAKMNDIDTIVQMLQEEFSQRLFAPVIDREIFLENLKKRPDFGIKNYYVAEKHGKIVGVCSVWDTSSFKQTKIIRMGKKIKYTQFIYSLFSFLFGFPKLPKEGEIIKIAAINEYAVQNRNPEIMKALLLKIYQDYRLKKFQLLSFGSTNNDPLLKATKSFFSQSVVSDIILFSKDPSLLNGDKIDISLPYVDIALL